MNSIEKSEEGWLIPKSPITFDYLKKFNRNMGILHLAQGLLMVLFDKSTKVEESISIL